MKNSKRLAVLLCSVLATQTVAEPMLKIHAESRLSDIEKTITKAQDGYQAIREYWAKELIGDTNGLQNDADLKKCIASLDAKTKTYLDTMLDTRTSEHLWDDSVYNDAVTGAKVTESLDRLKLITIQLYEPMSQWYQNEEAMKQVIDAYQFILNKKYGPDTATASTNWWDWQIGAPKSLVDVAILLYDELDEDTITKVTKTVDRFVPKADYRLNSTLKETGANLCDKVTIVIKRAALEGNEERLAHAKACMSDLFSYSNSGDGYYPDGSFIQHGNIPYNGSYGYVLLNELTNCIIMLNFTDYAINEKDIAFYENTLLHHYIPFLSYGGNMVDSVRGRAVSRKAQQGDTMGMQTMGVLLQYADVAATTETQKQIYTDLKGIVESKFEQEQTQDFSMLAYADYIRVKKFLSNDAVSGVQRTTFDVYSYMDRIVANRNDYTFTLAANSSRMCTEYGNSENILGRYQGQGYTQIYLDDINQYNEDYNATVDQNRLAGTTTAHQDLGFGTAGQSAWSGGSSLDGMNGASGFELTGNKKLTKLAGGFGSETDTGIVSGITAAKSYFVFGDKIVYLGSGITNKETDPSITQVESIIENRKTVDGMQVSVDGKTMVNAAGEESITNPTSAYLSGKTTDTGIGYVFLEDMEVNIKKETRSGTWNDVNKLAKFTDYSEVSNDYISMAVDHGTTPKDDTYSWIVLPNSSQKDIAAYLNAPTIEVLSNTSTLQAVKDQETGQQAYNFFKAGAYTSKDGSESLQVSGEASIVMKKDANGYQLAVSDPTRKQSAVDITIKGFQTLQHIGVTQGDAKVLSVKGDEMTIRVNFHEKDGQTRKIEIGVVYEIQSENLALHKTATASSVVQNSATAQRTANFAVDGDTSSRWASNYERSNAPISKEEADKGWLMVDLGKATTFNEVDILWQEALSNDYVIQVSDNGVDWTTVASVKETTGYKKGNRQDKITFDPVTASYVRMLSNENSRPVDGNGSPAGGLSIFEFEVYHAYDLKESMAYAQQLLNDYPEASAFQIPVEYQTLKQELETLLKAANDLIALGAAYEEGTLRSVASSLHKAAVAYDAAVLHVTNIEIAGEQSIVMNVNDTKELNVTFTPANAYNKELTWSSSNLDTATVKDGILTAKGIGTAVITATSKDGSIQTSIHVQVIAMPQSITLNKTSIELTKGTSFLLEAAISPFGATQDVNWISTDPDIASVSDQGNVEAKSVGSTTIIVQSKVDPAKIASCKVSVLYDLNVMGENIALTQGTIASGSSMVNNAAVSYQGAIDGDTSTRWASNYKDLTTEEAETQWWQMELPEAKTFNHIEITWFSTSVYGKEYEILVSMDGENWKQAYHETNGGSGTYAFDFDEVRAKFIRFQGIKRTASNGGYGMVEFEVYHKKNYDTIMTQAKQILGLYSGEATGHPAEYKALQNAVEAAEKLLEEQPDFTAAQLDAVLTQVIHAQAVYHAFIIPVTGIEHTQMDMRVNEEKAIMTKITPMDASNKEVIWINETPDILSIDQNGTIKALQKGYGTIKVTTKDGGYEAIVTVNVTTNKQPVINAKDIIIEVNTAFDPMQYASAYDEEDGELVLEIIENTVNTTKPGEGHVTYRVTDRDGNTIEKTMTVTIIKNSEIEAAREALNNKIKEAEKIDSSIYTEDSYLAVSKAILSGKLTAIKEDATKDELEAQTSAIEKAILALVKIDQADDTQTPEEPIDKDPDSSNGKDENTPATPDYNDDKEEGSNDVDTSDHTQYLTWITGFLMSAFGLCYGLRKWRKEEE